MTVVIAADAVATAHARRRTCRQAACRSAGKLAIEGKEYVMRDGAVVHFRFNV